MSSTQSAAPRVRRAPAAGRSTSRSASSGKQAKRKPSAPAKRSASGGRKETSKRQHAPSKMSTDRKSSARSASAGSRSGAKVAKQRKTASGSQPGKRGRASSAKQSARSTSSRSRSRSAPASVRSSSTGPVLVPNASPHTRCSIGWVPDPQNERRVIATLTLAEDFELDNKDHVGLLVELLRSNASLPTFTFAVWEALRPQIYALAPRASNGKKPPAGAYAGFFRVCATFASIAKKASHRRRKTGERRRLGFTLAHRVSDAFVAFANANGVDWKVGEFRARAKCNTLLFGHVRNEGLRQGSRIKVSAALAPLLDPSDPIAVDPATKEQFIPSKLLQTLLTRHHGPNLTAPSSCGTPPKDMEDVSPLPASLIRKGGSSQSGASSTRSSFRQLVRVSRAFAVNVAGWDPKTPHSRFVALDATTRYCRDHGLIVPPATAAENGAAPPATRDLRYRLDGVLRDLFTAADLGVSDEVTEVSYSDLRRLVRRLVGVNPKGESDCPPFEEIPLDNDAVPARYSDAVAADAVVAKPKPKRR